MKLFKTLLKLHFILLGFTSAFAFNEYINLANFSFLLASIYLFSRGKIRFKKRITPPLIAISIIYFLILLISSLIAKDTSPGHIISRIYFYLSLIIYSILLGNIKIDLGIIKSIFLGLIIGFSISIIDLMSISNLIPYKVPRIILDDLEVPFLFSYRLRGATEEPGYFAAYVASVIPIINWFYGKVNKKIIVIIIMTILTTFSAAFVIWASIFFTFIFLNGVRRMRFSGIFASFLLLGLVIIMAYVQIGDKIKGRSLNDRLTSYESVYILSSAEDFLLGLGPGAYKYYNVPQPTNLFLSTFFELGILGIVCYIITILLCYYSISGKNKFLKFGFLSFLLFWLSNGVYYHGYSILPLSYGVLTKRKKNENN